MPTKQPRINVTLKPSTYGLLRRMSELNKNSMSSIIGGLLEESEPVFERMVRVIEAAKAAQEGVRARVRENLEAAQAVLDKQLGLMLDDLGERGQDLVDELERVERRARAASAAGAASAPAQPATPPVTRGSGTPRGKGKGKGRGRS